EYVERLVRQPCKASPELQHPPDQSCRLTLSGDQGGRFAAATTLREEGNDDIVVAFLVRSPARTGRAADRRNTGPRHSRDPNRHVPDRYRSRGAEPTLNPVNSQYHAASDVVRW